MQTAQVPLTPAGPIKGFPRRHHSVRGDSGNVFTRKRASSMQQPLHRMLDGLCKSMEHSHALGARWKVSSPTIPESQSTNEGVCVPERKMNEDWRKREPQQPQASRVPPRTLDGLNLIQKNWRSDRMLSMQPSQAYHGPPPSEGLDPSICIRMKKAECKIGMIIRSPVYYQDWMDGLSDANAQRLQELDRNITLTISGHVYTKIRFQIVVKIHAEHYHAIPLFTYEGKGLDAKADQTKAEYISIRDTRNEGHFDNQSERGCLDAHCNHPTTLDRKSVALLSFPVHHHFDVAVKYAGQISEVSMADLRRNYNEVLTAE